MSNVKKSAVKTKTKPTLLAKKAAPKKLALKKPTPKKPVPKKAAPKKTISKKTIKPSQKQTKKEQTKKSASSKSVKNTAKNKPLKKSTVKPVKKNDQKLVAKKSAPKSSGKTISKKAVSEKKTSEKAIAAKKAVKPSSQKSIQPKPIHKDVSMTQVSPVALKQPQTKNLIKSSVKKKSVAVAVIPKKPIPVRRDFDPSKDPVALLQQKIAEERPQEVTDPGFLLGDDVFDETDHAQWQQIREQAAIHQRAMNLNKPETHPDFDGFHCVECDVEIPAKRLSLHKVRCVDCQNEIEEGQKRAARQTFHAPPPSNSSWD